MSVRALLSLVSLAVAVGAVPAQKPTKPNPDVDTLRDDLELLAAQLEVKKAQVNAAETKAQAAGEQLKRLEQLGGAISPTELAQLKSVADTAKAEVVIRKAELTEHQVKINVTNRRLDRVAQQPAANDAKDETLNKILAALVAREQADAARLEREKKEAVDRTLLEEKRRAEAVAAMQKEAEERAKVEREQRRQQLAERLNGLTAELDVAKTRIAQLEALKSAIEKELEQFKPKVER